MDRREILEMDSFALGGVKAKEFLVQATGLRWGLK